MKNLADSKLKFIVILKSKSKYLSQHEKLIFATHNANKLAEIKRAVKFLLK